MASDVEQYDVFLSCHRSDADLVRDLARALVEAGLSVFPEFSSFERRDWRKRLQTAFESSRVCLLVLGVDSLDLATSEPYLTTLAEWIEKDAGLLIPLLLPEFDQSVWGSLPPAVTQRQALHLDTRPLHEQAPAVVAAIRSLLERGSSTSKLPDAPPPFNRLSANARDALGRADRFQLSRGRGRVHMEHLLVGLYDAQAGQARKAFDSARVDRADLARMLSETGGVDLPENSTYLPTSLTAYPPVSKHVDEALRRAARMAKPSLPIFSELVLAGALQVADCRVSTKVRERSNLLTHLGVAALPASEATSQTADLTTTAESVLLASAADQATKDDRLGFKPYVEAVAEFLASADTKPPLTLSVEGEWGSGKSSFMLQLEECLRVRADPLGGWVFPPCCLTVRFNAWRHDKEEALWAAFAVEFVRRVARQRFFVRRWLGHLSLFFNRYRWRDGWFDLLRWAGVWLFLLVLGLGIPLAFWLSRDTWFKGLHDQLAAVGIRAAAAPKGAQDPYSWLAAFVTLGGSGAYLAGFISLLLQAKKLFGNPLEVNLRKYLRSPDYEGRVAFIERFHEDFGHIVKAYAGDHKVYVFIDDLDRCEVPKAADLMQALNLMIADDPRLIFIIGLDREKVAAGLAVKYEKLLPYLMPATETPSSNDDLRRFGREYGYSFLEKFIQLPFRVPAPEPADMGRFLWPGMGPLALDLEETGSARGEDHAGDGEGGGPQEAVEPAALEAHSQRGKAVSPAPESSTGTPDPATQIARQRRARLQFGKDSDSVRKAALMVGPTLDHNPRRLKQFVNLLRLRAYIANATGLFDERDGRPALTLEQLAKFVAIGLVWPGVLSAIQQRPTLLARLEEAETHPPGENRLDFVERCWWNEPKLRRLLREGRFTADGKPLHNGGRFSLAEVDMDKLLRVSPVLEQVAAASSPDLPAGSPPDRPRA